ncbi:MAG: hypothetical protein AAF645_09580, partial [Myxococcota bacterium]
MGWRTPSSRHGRTVLAAVVLSAAHALPSQAQQVPVIEAGREGDVLALFAPFSMGDALPSGERIQQVQIEARYIVVVLDSGARLQLRHPDDVGP